jgi:type II secretory pathway component PulM
MSELLERLRGMWDDLNEREKRLVAVLGIAFATAILALPLVWTARQNGEIEEENTQLRSTLELIGQRRGLLLQIAETRKAAVARYRHHTPPLGSFLENEAKNHGLTIREVTDQPEKATGNYFRRSVRASVNEVGLTGIMDLLSSLNTNENPVAVDQIQIEHYQAGDSYRFKIGVLTFDRKEGKDKSEDNENKKNAKSETEASGG